MTIAKVRAWRDGLVTAEKRLRTARYADKPNVLVVDLKDPEAIRRRRDTANRTLTTLKAALNWAYNNRLVTDDTVWRLVKPYRSTGSARIRFLSDDEQKKMLAASNGSIRDLISAALVTGARFSELAQLTVADYDHENRSVFISESKSGKPRHVPPRPAGLCRAARCGACANPSLTVARDSRIPAAPPDANGTGVGDTARSEQAAELKRAWRFQTNERTQGGFSVRHRS